MKFTNKIPLLLMFPVVATIIYFIGGNVADLPSMMVHASRQWLLIFTGVYAMNYFLAWILKNSWPAAMIRMLICGLFAYVAISELVDLLGSMWGHWSQLLGGNGTLPPATVHAVRYATTAWTVALVLMAMCIGLGFESESATDD